MATIRKDFVNSWVFYFLRTVAWLFTFSGAVMGLFLKSQQFGLFLALGIFALSYLLNLIPGTGNYPQYKFFEQLLATPVVALIFYIAINWSSMASVAGIVMLIGFLAFLFIGYPFLGRRT
jgi:hypothetical protein